MNIKKYINALILAIFMSTAFGCASTDKHEGTGEYIDDSVITAKVKTALIRDDDVKAREVNVETFKGVVQLSGFVHDARAKAKAVELARQIKGVKSVKDNMQVK